MVQLFSLFGALRLQVRTRNSDQKLMKVNWSDLCILIVDDDAYLRSSLADLLEMQGAIVAQAEHGGKALEILKNQKISLVVSDIKMPVLGGVDLLKAIRSQNSKPPAVILITGESSYSEQEILKLGGNGVIRKPFDIPTFFDRIEDLFLRSQAA